MLIDNYGRQFSYLRLSLTDKCNYRCSYCLPDGYQNQQTEQDLSLDEVEQIARVFVNEGIQKIRLTGGEPSLRKDLVDVISRLRKIPDLKTIALTTNGYRLARDAKAWSDAGLDQINVSIDSLDQQKFHQITGHDHLPKILSGLDQAIELGLRVKVNAVLMKDINHQDISQFVDFVRHRPITIRFIEVMRTNHQQTFFAEHHVRGLSIRDQLLQEGWLRVERIATDGPAEEYWHPEYIGRIGLIMPYDDSFCASCNRLRIDHLGRLHLCLFASEAIDLRPMLTQDSSATNCELAEYLHRVLPQKTASHLLHLQQAGHTNNLSSIGG